MITYLLFVIGIFLLIRSADWIVDGASSLARKFGVSALVIGLTVVAFGTSLPELVVNIFAAVGGNGGVAFGNIVGSNIANILLVLGVSALITSIPVKNETIWNEIPFAMLAAFVLFVLAGEFFGTGEGFLTRSGGMILLGMFAIFLWHVFMTTRKDRKKIGLPENSDEPKTTIIWKIVLGLVGIYFGGKWVVDGAVLMAGQLGLSEFLISATIIAVGTSLPELVVSVVAAKKGNIDLAVGNVVGSNIFNVLWVFGIIPFFGKVLIPEFVLFDIAVMFFATLLLFIFVFVGKKGELSKTEGIVFLMLYGLYIWFLIWRG
ncbi:calcium/sodium antiporter [Methanococcoides sp. SA1]|nr:calcium/sodium antiporter [Methanococcoides sp. SA1]